MTTATATISVERPDELAPPLTVADSGLNVDLIVQLVVKALHFAGELTGTAIADKVGLPFAVVEPAIDRMKTLP